jgi:hypothetical protein
VPDPRRPPVWTRRCIMLLLQASSRARRHCWPKPDTYMRPICRRLGVSTYGADITSLGWLGNISSLLPCEVVESEITTNISLASASNCHPMLGWATCTVLYMYVQYPIRAPQHIQHPKSKSALQSQAPTDELTDFRGF